MRTLHVVMGLTGEYSDRTEWPVRAFVVEKAAQDFVLMADAWLRERHWHEDSRSPNVARFDRRTDHCPFDEKLEVDYTGAAYYVMQVPLDDDVRLEIAETVAEDVSAGRLRRGIRLLGKEGP